MTIKLMNIKDIKVSPTLTESSVNRNTLAVIHSMNKIKNGEFITVKIDTNNNLIDGYYNYVAYKSLNKNKVAYEVVDVQETTLVEASTMVIEEDTNYINIEDISIYTRFKYSYPSIKKIELKMDLIKSNQFPKVKLTRTFTLIDGYASYIAYKSLGYTHIPYDIASMEEEMTYFDMFYESSIRMSKRDFVTRRDNNTCYICQRKLTPKDITLDHVIPVCKGGDSSDMNLRCCCKLCNSLKGSFTYSEALVEVIRSELKERGIL